MRGHRWLAMMVLGLLILLTGCGGSGSTGQTPSGSAGNPPGTTGSFGGSDVIKIGFFAPKTGPAAADGESATNSARLAVDQINSAGGVLGKKLELVEYDDQLDPKQAVAIAQRLTTRDGVVAVVSGSYSGPTRAAAPIFERAKLPMIAAYAVHPDIPKAGDFIFQQSFSGVVQGRAAAVVAAEQLKAKRISILSVDNDFGQTIVDGFREQAQKLGLEIVSTDKFKIGDKEFSPILTKINEQNPDVLFVVGYAPEGAQIVRQARSLGLKAKILGTEGLDSTVQFLEVVGDAGDGVVIVTNLNRDDTDPQTQAYIKAYRDRYGHDPDMVGASVYDAFQLLAEAIKRAGSTDPVAIRNALAGITDFRTVTGPLYRYDEIGQALKPVAVQQVKDGAFHHLSEVTSLDVITPPQP